VRGSVTRNRVAATDLARHDAGMTQDWLQRLAERIDSRPPGPLAVGYSGGLDSTVLLHALTGIDAARRRGLRAIHIDHGLQTDSGRWAEHCRTQADALGIEFQACRVAVDRQRGLGLEGAARLARYTAFATALRAGETLLLAQHRDDQAETILLRLLRAAGGAALAGMREERALGQGRLWRPLLDVPRAALAAYAQAHRLAWIDDPSNQDPRHARNFLRHEILPRLRARWPQAEASFATSARLLAEDAALIARQAASALAQIQGLDPATLSIPRLLQQPPPLRAHVVRLWLAGLGLAPPPASLLERLAAELITARGDGTPLLAWSGQALRRYREQLYAGRLDPPWPESWETTWDGSAPLPLPDGAVLVFSAVPQDLPRLRVRARRGGETLASQGRPRVPLKALLQENGVPPWERARMPLLLSEDGRLLAAGDLFFADEFDRWLRERGIGLRWRQPDPALTSN